MRAHLLRSISRRQSEWMVCPHGSTAVGLTLSKRYSKHTGQFWRMLFSTQTWLPCAADQSHAWHSVQEISSALPLSASQDQLGSVLTPVGPLCRDQV